jgi:hypothetical protein
MQCNRDTRITVAPRRNAAIDTRYPIGVFFNRQILKQPDF